jgi:hypothetical protein
MDATKAPSAVIEAVRERQAKLRVELGVQQEDAKQAETVLNIKKAVIEATRQELRELAEFLNVNAPGGAVLLDTPVEIEPGTGSISAEATAPEVAATTKPRRVVSGTAIKTVVVEEAVKMLARRPWMTTDAIAETLADQGISLDVMHPVTRISQILSLHKRIFQNERGFGWRLIKGEPPVAAGDSGATQAFTGQPTSGV